METIGTAGAEAARLNAVFAAIADPTRRAILARLAAGEATVTELGKPFQLSQPAISKHLRVLERAGLVTGGQDAQRRPRRLEPRALAPAEHWLTQFRELWEARYEQLDVVLAEVGERARPLRSKRTRKGNK